MLRQWQARALRGRELAPSTREVHAWAAALITAELGRVALADLDARAVERAFDRLAGGSQGRPLGRASLIKIRSTLSQAITWATKRGLVDRNVAASADLTPDATPGTARTALDAKQLAAVFAECADHPFGAMFVVMGTIGLHPGEAAGLCCDAVDLDAGTVSIVRAVHVERGVPVLVA